MPNEREVRAGGAYVEIGADDKRLEKTLGSAKAQLDNFARQVGVLGAALAGLAGVLAAPIKRATDELAKHGDAMAKMAKRTGLAVETVSRFQHVAELSGASIETFESGVRNMQRAIYDARRGSMDAVEALQALGLTFGDLEGRSPEEQFAILGGAIGQMRDATMRAGVAMKLFGRSGTALIPLFTEGGEAIRGMMMDADRLGVTFNSKLAKNAEILNDENFRLQQSFLGVKLAIAQQVLPVVLPLIQAITEAAIKVREWITQNQALVVGAMKLIGIIGALGVILAGAAAAWFLLTSVAAGWIIIGAAVAGVIIAIIENVTDLDSGLGAFLDSFSIFGKTLRGHFDLIQNTFLIGWNEIKSYFSSGIEVLKTKWTGFLTTFADGFDFVMNKLGLLSDEELQANVSARAAERDQRQRDQDAAVGEDIKSREDLNAALMEVRKGLEDAEAQRQKNIQSAKAKSASKFQIPSVGFGGLPIPNAPSREAGGVVGLFAGSRIGEQLGVTGGGVEKQQLDVAKQMRDTLGRIESNTRNQAARFA